MRSGKPWKITYSKCLSELSQGPKDPGSLSVVLHRQSLEVQYSGSHIVTCSNNAQWTAFLKYPQHCTAPPSVWAVEPAVRASMPGAGGDKDSGSMRVGCSCAFLICFFKSAVRWQDLKFSVFQ